MRLLAALALAAWLPLQAAEPAGSEAQERARIAAERQAVEAAHAARVRDCQGRFAVTPCIEEARAVRREKLIALRRQQSLLDEAQRKQRAAERMATIRERVSAEEARQHQPAAAPRGAPMRIVAPRAGKAAVAPAPPASAASAARAAAEARQRARYEARQREAQLQRDEAQRRAAERAASGKAPAAPLPPAPAP